MMRNDFGLLILSHGRAGNVKTLDTMKYCGYTGKWYIVVDNEDPQQDLYRKEYGDEHVVVFDKLKKYRESDPGDLYPKRNGVLYARNACFEIAESLGLAYFLELDDDYIEFRSRFDKDGKLSSAFVMDMDSIINACLEFLEVSGAYSIAWSQMGDFIGGLGCSMFRDRITRKVMNSFFCKTSRKFSFYGRMNDDVNTYVLEGSRGKLFMTIADVSLNQIDTQQASGGLTDMYLDNGTYIKSFFSVMYNPSSVRISTMGVGHIRFHHSVDWEACAPKIVSDRFKK